MNFEMNNVHKDEIVNRDIKKNSPVVEVFSAMINGRDLPSYADAGKADKAVEYIKKLAGKAANGDLSAAAEMNQIRREVINPELLQELKLLDWFGAYEPLGAGETVEREVRDVTGGAARIQALNGDVRFPITTAKRYFVTPENISAGYQVDYRALAGGDAYLENVAKQQVQTEMMNLAAQYVMKKIYNAIKNATGVKYFAEAAGLTKEAVDKVVKAVRRHGPTSLIGTYAVVSQINDFAPYTNGAATPIVGVSEAMMEEIRKTGLTAYYNGSIVREIPTLLDYNKLNAAGDDFAALAPEGLLYVLPTGVDSPVKSWTIGGLTSFTGNDVSTGRLLTRFDLTIAADVAKGHEYKIGLLNDTNITPAADMAL